MKMLDSSVMLVPKHKNKMFEAIPCANRLLVKIGVNVKVQSLRECVPSLFVALFEGLLRLRIPGIIRNAKSRAEKGRNMQLLIRMLESGVLGGSSLAHIDPLGLVDMHERDIENLMHVFGELESVLPTAFPSAPFMVANGGPSLATQQNSGFTNQFRASAAVATRASSLDMQSRLTNDTTSSLNMVDDVEEFILHKGRQQSTVGKSPFKLEARAHFKLLKPFTSIQALPSPDDNNLHTHALKLNQQHLRISKNLIEAKIEQTQKKAKQLHKLHVKCATSFSRTSEQTQTSIDQTDREHAASESSDTLGQLWSSGTLIPESKPFSDAASALQSTVEQNLFNWESAIKAEVGITDIPKETKIKVWNEQLLDHQRHLRSRLYERKVHLNKELSKITNLVPIHTLEMEMEHTAKMIQAKQELSSLRDAKIALINQRRRVNGMQHQILQTKREVTNAILQKKYKEEQLANQLYSEYLSSQRKLIIENAQISRNQYLADSNASELKQGAKDAYIKDQIQLLKEDLAEAKKEEALVTKSYAHEMRKLIKEQKETTKQGVHMIKAKLNVDANDIQLQTQSATNLRKKYVFKLKK
ncbi:hypothetical protein BC830DRAFT_186555 [Chytriomyces sp. MP71]|nr:hypothetical protein BC830DRAFT_186555 [Chytriomyces sp. MP71]